jgi:pimeloyl-ACP methyl ester carboxylesterase
MGSAGTYGGGRDELRDARAAVARARDASGLDEPPTIVVGWSFGASVAVREALDDRRVTALVLVGTPLRPDDVVLPPLPEPADLRLFKRPALMLSGEHDEYCPPEDVHSYAAGFPGVQVEIVPGTDHYFWRREREAADIVGAFAQRSLELTPP